MPALAPLDGTTAPLPALPSRPLGASRETMCNRVVAETVGSGIREEVRRTGYPGFSAPLLDALVARAVAEVEAATPPPPDPDNSLTDRSAIESLALLSQNLQEARERVQIAEGERREQAARLASLPQPLLRKIWLLVAGGMLLLTVEVAVAVAALMSPSVDAFLLRAYAESFLDGGAERWSATAAFCLALLCSSALLVPPAVATIFTSGRLGRWKLGIIFSEILFSVSFALVRLGEHVTAQAISVSGFELALLLGHSFALLAVTQLLDGDRAKAETFVKGQAQLAAAEADLAGVKEKAQFAEHALSEQLKAIEYREEAVRRFESNRQLVIATVTASYLLAVAELVNEAAGVKAEETLTGNIEEHLGELFQCCRAAARMP